MRLLIAMMKHETNTFSPIRTDWQRFLDWGAYFGEDARRAGSADVHEVVAALS